MNLDWGFAGAQGQQVMPTLDHGIGKMIVIEVIFEALAGKRDDFNALSLRTMVASKREQGYVLYRFTSDIEHALRFNLIEIWKTEEDLKAHFQGDAFKNFFAELPNIGKSVSHMAWQGTLSPYVPPNPMA